MNQKEEQEQKINNSNNKGGYSIQRMTVKQKAVEDYEKGTMTIQELLAKYQVCHTTLWNWRRQIKKGNDDQIIRRNRHPEELKLRIVKEIVTGVFKIKEAATHYNVRKSTIENWCSKYSCQISDLTEPMAKKKQVKESVPQSDHVRQLERALEDANLKIIGLETMINIAEKDLKIDIRKKSGTKQSKS